MDKKSFYQWDLDQRLELSDVEVGTEIHFCNPQSKDTECLTVFAKEENGVVYAEVPNMILQIPGIFKVYVWPFHTTQYQQITVIARPKPADYIYEEVEILSIEAVVNAALEKAKESGEFDGKDGKDGKDGLDGYTPQRGVDYWTPADVAEIKSYVDEQLGDLDAALDAIIAIQNKLIGVISFTIYYDGDGNTVCLEADEGMTWGEWCESEHNTIGAYFSPDSDVLLHDYNGKTHCIYHTLDNETGTFTNVYSVDVIERNHQYLCVDL